MFVTVQGLGRDRDKFRTFSTTREATTAKPSHVLQPWHTENLPGVVIMSKSRLSCNSNAPDGPVHAGFHAPLLSCSEELNQAPPRVPSCPYSLNVCWVPDTLPGSGDELTHPLDHHHRSRFLFSTNQQDTQWPYLSYH